MTTGRPLTDEDIRYLQQYVAQGDRLGYYGALSNWGYDYPRLASQVVDSSSLAGRLANVHMAETAADAGIVVDPDMAASVSRDLMQADFESRAAMDSPNRRGNPLGVDIIEGYHHNVFDRYGLPPEAWTATVPLEIAAQRHTQLGFESPTESRNHLWQNLMSRNGLGQALATRRVLANARRGDDIDPATQAMARNYYRNAVGNSLDEALYLGTGLGSAYPPDGSPQPRRSEVFDMPSSVSGWGRMLTPHLEFQPPRGPSFRPSFEWRW